MSGTFCFPLCYFFRLSSWLWVPRAGAWKRHCSRCLWSHRCSLGVPAVSQCVCSLSLPAWRAWRCAGIGVREGRGQAEGQPVCWLVGMLVAVPCQVLTITPGAWEPRVELRGVGRARLPHSTWTTVREQFSSQLYGGDSVCALLFVCLLFLFLTRALLSRGHFTR